MNKVVVKGTDSGGPGLGLNPGSAACWLGHLDPSNLTFLCLSFPMGRMRIVVIPATKSCPEN